MPGLPEKAAAIQSSRKPAGSSIGEAPVIKTADGTSSTTACNIVRGPTLQLESLKCCLGPAGFCPGTIVLRVESVMVVAGLPLVWERLLLLAAWAIGQNQMQWMRWRAEASVWLRLPKKPRVHLRQKRETFVRGPALLVEAQICYHGRTLVCRGRRHDS
jgi:hypothetical protein